MNCVFAFLLFTSTGFLLSHVVDGGAALAVACPVVCTAFVTGGVTAANAAGIAAGVANPILGILIAALEGAAGAAGVGMTVAGCTTVCTTALSAASCFDEETISTVLENGKLQDVPLRRRCHHSVIHKNKANADH